MSTALLFSYATQSALSWYTLRLLLALESVDSSVAKEICTRQQQCLPPQLLEPAILLSFSTSHLHWATSARGRLVYLFRRLLIRRIKASPAQSAILEPHSNATPPTLFCFNFFDISQHYTIFIFLADLFRILKCADIDSLLSVPPATSITAIIGHISLLACLCFGIATLVSLPYFDAASRFA